MKLIALKQLWETIPESNRQETLQALSRLVVQQLPAHPAEKEACNEDC